MNNLTIKPIGQVTGNLLVPDHLRGYRWDDSQVTALLDDIFMNEEETCYLPPIVLVTTGRPSFDAELADGHQLLTSVSLISGWFAAIRRGRFEEIPADTLDDINTGLGYTLSYENGCPLNDIVESYPRHDTPEIALSPDCLNIWHAYGAIVEWGRDHDADDVRCLAEHFAERVRVPVYQVEGEKCFDVFLRTNAGRIPFSNADLLKALFLKSYEADCSPEEQQKVARKAEMAEQWSRIERDMADPQFYHFIAGRRRSVPKARIEALFDVLAGKPDEEPDYSTYNYFADPADPDSLENSVWGEEIDAWLANVWQLYLQLRDWYSCPEVYNRVAFLVNFCNCRHFDLLAVAGEKGSKYDFMDYLEYKLRDELRVPVSLGCPSSHVALADLSSCDDGVLILRLITWANVLEADRLGQRYPFHLHRAGRWCLGQIHECGEEALTARQQLDWVSRHLVLLNNINLPGNIIAELSSRMTSFRDNAARRTDREFLAIREQYSDLLTDGDYELYKDNISNLALLSTAEDSALTKCFAEKRAAVVARPAAEFIPPLTRAVFLKALGPTGSLSLWTERDRLNYLMRLDSLLHDYYYQPQNEETK